MRATTRLLIGSWLVRRVRSLRDETREPPRPTAPRGDNSTSHSWCEENRRRRLSFWEKLRGSGIAGGEKEVGEESPPAQRQNLLSYIRLAFFSQAIASFNVSNNLQRCFFH